MSSTQLAKKIVTIGIYRYLTIYRDTQFTSSDILETVKVQPENEWLFWFVPKMSRTDSDPFIGCQVLYQVAEYVEWQRAR